MQKEVVYFIECQAVNLIKIGKTQNYKLAKRPDYDTAYKRPLHLQTASPVPLDLINTTRFFSESKLHETFAQLRRRGEWFEGHKVLRIFITQVAKAANIDEATVILNAAITELAKHFGPNIIFKFGQNPTETGKKIQNVEITNNPS
jgi:hypothetical protein